MGSGSVAAFVLAELAKFAIAYGDDAIRFASQFEDDFSASNPELIRPGDEDAPEPPARDAIDAEVDAAIDEGEV